MLEAAPAGRIVVNNEATVSVVGEGGPINILRVNRRAVETFGIDLNDKETDLSVLNETCNPKRVPVWLGNRFRSKYEKGDLIKIDSGGCRFIVKGFLKKGEYYIDSFQQKDAIVLDNYIVAPANWQNDGLIECTSNVMNSYLVCNDKTELMNLLGPELADEISFVGLADEPTGALDRDTGLEVIKNLRKINQECGTTIVIVTHDTEVAGMCERVIELSDIR